MSEQAVLAEGIMIELISALEPVAERLAKEWLESTDGESTPVDTPEGLAGYMTIQEVANLTRLPSGTLRYYRHDGKKGPKSFKLGRRVLYRREDVMAWIAAARS